MTIIATILGKYILFNCTHFHRQADKCDHCHHSNHTGPTLWNGELWTTREDPGNLTSARSDLDDDENDDDDHNDDDGDDDDDGEDGHSTTIDKGLKEK